MRTNKPAPISSTSDTATCVTSRALLSSVRDPVTLRLFSFMAPARSTRVARAAGMRPNTTPVRMLTPATKAITRQSIAAFWPKGSSFLLQ